MSCRWSRRVSGLLRVTERRGGRQACPRDRTPSKMAVPSGEVYGCNTRRNGVGRWSASDVTRFERHLGSEGCGHGGSLCTWHGQRHVRPILYNFFLPFDFHLLLFSPTFSLTLQLCTPPDILLSLSVSHSRHVIESPSWKKLRGPRLGLLIPFF